MPVLAGAPRRVAAHNPGRNEHSSPEWLRGGTELGFLTRDTRSGRVSADLDALVVEILSLETGKSRWVATE